MHLKLPVVNRCYRRALIEIGEILQEKLKEEAPAEPPRPHEDRRERRAGDKQHKESGD